MLIWENHFTFHQTPSSIHHEKNFVFSLRFAYRYVTKKNAYKIIITLFWSRTAGSPSGGGGGRSSYWKVFDFELCTNNSLSRYNNSTLTRDDISTRAVTDQSIEGRNMATLTRTCFCRSPIPLIFQREKWIFLSLQSVYRKLWLTTARVCIFVCSVPMSLYNQTLFNIMRCLC